jgi:hypothetical protein
MKRTRGMKLGRLAMLYYPERGYKRAVQLFREELCQTRGLREALQEVGYHDKMRVLNLRQIHVIEQYLGEP